MFESQSEVWTSVTSDAGIICSHTDDGCMALNMYRVRQNKISQHENYCISEMLEFFAQNFAHLFGTKLCTNVLLCAVFT